MAETALEQGFSEKEVLKALALIKIRTTDRYAADPGLQLAVQLRLSKLPPEILAEASNRWADDPTMLDGVQVRRSRRLALEAEHQGRLQSDPDAKMPLVVKVLIAGSGYNGWATQVESNSGAVLNWEREDDPDDGVESTRYGRDKGKGTELMFAGPGGTETKGGYFNPKAARDVGSNSIAELVAQVPEMVDQAIAAGLAEDAERSIVILIKAHSRGAVAGGQIRNILQGRYPAAKVELVQVEPVPGPDHSGDDVELDLRGAGGGLADSTLVYSVASGYTAGFTPQKVHGARRILISKQNHSAGLMMGFTYDGELYKGSGLNSLPDGVYVDMNENGENSVPLVRVGDIDAAKLKIDEAFKKSKARNRDYNRMDIIKSILDEYFEL